jgi:hypothetical protein
MFGNDPWHDDFGRWRLLRVPTVIVGVIALAWLFQYGSLLFSVAEWFLVPDGDTTLELPNDLVLAQLPWSHTWRPDPASDGVLLALPDADATQGGWAVERWSRPWKEGTREPIPEAWHLATQPDWRNDTAMVCYFGLNSPVTRDRSLLAVTYHDHRSTRVPQTRILALPDGQEIARVNELPAGANGKCIAWHPTEHVLAIGSYGFLTLAAAPDWKARRLATVTRDRLEWERRARAGEEESGYYPNENVSQLLFSDDGTWLIAAMDRGMRVYDWEEVRNATGRLPPPRYAADGVLVKQPLFNFKMSFAVAYDSQRRLVLWSENDGKLKFLDLTSGAQGTLLALSNRYCMTRLHLCAAGDALVTEIVRFGKSNNGSAMLAVLDYPRLLQMADGDRKP